MKRSLGLWMVVALVVAMTFGCANRKSGTAGSDDGTDAGDIPRSLTVDVEATVPTLVSVSVSASGTDLSPGDPVRVDAATSAPTEYTVEVGLVPEGWANRQRLASASGDGKYSATLRLPSVPQDEYRVRAFLVDPSGNVVDRQDSSPFRIGPGPNFCPEIASQLEELRVNFPFDSSKIEASERDTLAQVVADLKALGEQGGYELMITGHCDERGTVEYNLALGRERAEAVKSYLLDALGSAAEAGEFRLNSKGEEEPLVEGSNEEAWAQNRRTEFDLTCPTR